MKNHTYGTPVPNRSDFNNAQLDHPIQVQLRKEERGGRYTRSKSKSRGEQTVLVETGRGLFHTEVGKLQADITARVRAGTIKTQSELIEATRNAYDLAARITGVQVDTQALDRAIVSNLATLSENSSQTHSELVAQGATAADFDAQIASVEQAFVDPSPPVLVDAASERGRASGLTTASSGLVNQSVAAPEQAHPEQENYEASLGANLSVLAIGAYLVAAPVVIYLEEAGLVAVEEAVEEAVEVKIRVELRAWLAPEVRALATEAGEAAAEEAVEVVEEVAEETLKQMSSPWP